MTKNTARFSFGQWLKTKASEILSSSGGFTQGLYGEIRTPLNGISLMGLRLSVDSLFTVWRNHGDVYACVRELKENVGSQGYIWSNKQDSNKDADSRQVSEVEKILNYGQSFRSLKNKAIQHSQISGNAYLLILRSKEGGKVLGFDVIDPRTLSVVTDKYGVVHKWIQRVNGETQEYEPNEVLHFKHTDDPNSPIFGLSALEPIIWETRTDLSAMITNYAFFANDATPGAQYILEDGILEEDKQKIVEDLRRQLQGPENRNKSIVMQGVKEVKTLQISQKDMEFNLLRRFTTEKICAAYGVPKGILGYTDSVNYSNGENQEQKFWEGTIQPLQELWAEFINTKVLPALGIDGIKIEYNVKSFEDSQWNEASTRADQQQGILTLNEIREKRGYGKLEPGVYGEWVDKPLIFNGLSVKPLEDIGIEMNDDGTPAILSEDQATKELQRIDRIAKRSGHSVQQDKTDKSVMEAKIKAKLERESKREIENEKKRLAAKVRAALENNE